MDADRGLLEPFVESSRALWSNLVALADDGVQEDDDKVAADAVKVPVRT
jgi:hypothetical protein